MSLPSRILNKLIALEKKIVTYPLVSKLKQFKQKYDDDMLNRELLVTDKYGNRYYQHYSNQGIPTKRYAALNMKGINRWDEDPTMLAWLQYRRLQPPTQEELEKIYIQQEEHERRGLEWDMKDQRLIEEYSTKRKQAIDQERRETGAIGIGEKFLPGRWEAKMIESGQVSVIGDRYLIDKPTWDVLQYENIHGLKGKYEVDFINDDKEWMEMKQRILYAPIEKQLATLPFNEITPSVVSELFNKEHEEKIRDHNNKKKELTNLGKKMLEKKEKYKDYNNFRERFSDIYQQLDYGN